MKKQVNVLGRSDFPKDFIFGTASSAYQFEGAAKEDGRGPSIWDTFVERTPGKVKGGATGNNAVDTYHLYKEDVKLMKKVGLDAYRFSISWSRILPGGKLSAGINKEGIQYYNDLINKLLANGIEPFVTLFHWDLPQALEDDYGGFLSTQIVEDFYNFAELCFWEFGDRVKNWITLNEPWSYSLGGYVLGTFAPGRGASSPDHVTSGTTPHVHGRCSAWHGKGCNTGNPGIEPYIVTHNQLLAHAAAVELYKQKYQIPQGGKIGITLVAQWMEPLDEKNDLDVKAASRALDFMFGWFMEPLTTGDYPQSMRKFVGNRLPKFSAEQAKKLIQSYDFLGVNYYTATYVTDGLESTTGKLSYSTDSKITYKTEKDGKPIGPKGGSDWLHIYPQGIYKLLVQIKNAYKDPIILITENGVNEVNDTSLTLSEARIDKMRVDYHHDHLCYVKKAIAGGVDVKGYFAWSFLDNFEWGEGYGVRFGLFYIDYNDGYARYPKTSAIWFMNFLAKGKTNNSTKKRCIKEGDDENGNAKKARN